MLTTLVPTNVFSKSKKVENYLGPLFNIENAKTDLLIKDYGGWMAGWLGT